MYHVVWIILTGVYSWQWAGDDPEQQVKWFIFLTDWCYFVLTVSTLVDAACVVYIFFCRVDIKNGGYNLLFSLKKISKLMNVRHNFLI